MDVHQQTNRKESPKMTVNEARLARKIPDPLLKNASEERLTTISEWEQKRDEILALLAEKEYGIIPEKPEHLDVTVLSCDPVFLAGKATFCKLLFTAKDKNGLFSFPVCSVIPNNPCGKLPAFVLLNIRPGVPDVYYPVEEIIDRGYAVFSFCYLDVSSDEDNFEDEGARFLCRGRHKRNAPGKISMWAWAAMRVADYVGTLPEIDQNRLAVIGHSRLGKTALWAGANDTRFSFVISNDSGCSGAAIGRGKTGERKDDITLRFPYWFCHSYNAPTAIENLPFDQNFLLAMIPPRHLMVGSAIEDLWADPASEYLGTALTNDIYALYGMRGLVSPDVLPSEPCVYGEGDALYRLRNHRHYLSREDWNAYIDFIDSKSKTKDV